MAPEIGYTMPRSLNWPQRWAKRPQGWLKRPQDANTYLTLISICSSISLFLMAAYSFSSLLGTWGQGWDTRTGTRTPGPVPRDYWGEPPPSIGARLPISPLHLLGVVLDLEGPEDELVRATVKLVRDHLLEILRGRKLAMKRGPKIQAIAKTNPRVGPDG